MPIVTIDRRMKVLSLFLITLSLVSYLQADCSDAESSASDIYYYAKKGLSTDSLDDAKKYAKKAMYAAEDAESSASDCSCPNSSNTESYSSDAYHYAKKAYKASNRSDCHRYLKKAKSYAEDIESSASDCENN